MLRSTVIAFATTMVLATSALAQGMPAPSDGRPVATQYLLMVYETPTAQQNRTDPRLAARYWEAFKAFGDSLGAAGVLRGGMVLQGQSQARTVTVRGGKTVVATGARASVAEEFGGYFIIEVPTMDDAVRWAARVPAALTGAVEVRPSFPAPTMGR